MLEQVSGLSVNLELILVLRSSGSKRSSATSDIVIQTTTRSVANCRCPDRGIDRRLSSQNSRVGALSEPACPKHSANLHRWAATRGKQHATSPRRSAPLSKTSIPRYPGANSGSDPRRSRFCCLTARVGFCVLRSPLTRRELPGGGRFIAGRRRGTRGPSRARPRFSRRREGRRRRRSGSSAGRAGACGTRLRGLATQRALRPELAAGVSGGGERRRRCDRRAGAGEDGRTRGVREQSGARVRAMVDGGHMRMTARGRPHAPGAFPERDAAGADAEREQAAGGELGAERPASQQPASARSRSSGDAGGGHPAADPSSNLCASGAGADATARSQARVSDGFACEDCGAEPAGQEHRRQRRGEAAQRDDVGTARRARGCGARAPAGSARLRGRGCRRRARASASPAPRTSRRRGSSARARRPCRRRRGAPVRVPSISLRMRASLTPSRAAASERDRPCR